MLSNPSEQVRECLQRADECARKAAAEADGSPLKQDFLDLEKKWRSLARSFQLSERLTDFSADTKRNAAAPITPFLRGQAFDPETIEAMGKALLTTCQALDLRERDDSVTRLVAEKIIELAQRGIKEPTALHSAALEEFKSNPQ